MDMDFSFDIGFFYKNWKLIFCRLFYFTFVFTKFRRNKSQSKGNIKFFFGGKFIYIFLFVKKLAVYFVAGTVLHFFYPVFIQGISFFEAKFPEFDIMSLASRKIL